MQQAGTGGKAWCERRLNTISRISRIDVRWIGVDVNGWRDCCLNRWWTWFCWFPWLRDPPAGRRYDFFTICITRKRRRYTLLNIIIGVIIVKFATPISRNWENEYSIQQPAAGKMRRVFAVKFMNIRSKTVWITFSIRPFSALFLNRIIVNFMSFYSLRLLFKQDSPRNIE